MYKNSDFLMKILALLVFRLCHIFHANTLWKHNPLGHRHFFLHFPQCTKIFLYFFQRHKWKLKHCLYFRMQVGVTTIVKYSYVGNKEDIFRPSNCEKWNKHPFTHAFVRSSQIAFTYAILKAVMHYERLKLRFFSMQMEVYI